MQFRQAVFGNNRPVEIEIGPGTGTFILSAAAQHPDVNFLGIEHSHSRAARLEAEVQAARLRNAIVIAGDASCIITTVIPAASVRAYHIYFPDPWWKRRHHRRRLFTPPFAAALARTLEEGGRLFVATDVDDVFALITECLAAVHFVAAPHLRSPRTAQTAFERKGAKRGARIHEAAFVKCLHRTIAAL